MSSTLCLTLTMLSSVTDNIMEEIKFNIYGTMFHQNGYSRSDCLSFIAATKEEALATCKRNYPLFEIISVWIDESEHDVVKLQPLR